MSNQRTDLAGRFVDLILSHQGWQKIKELSTAELQILIDVVSTAGFKVTAVVTGQLTGNYLGQDGRPDGRTYPINHFCPFKVVGRDGGDHQFATGWLDCAFRRVVNGSTIHREGREQLVVVMVAEIEQSIPLAPIQLTPEGDFLSEYSPSILALGLEYFVRHTRDGDGLGSCVGVHDGCNGWMDREHINKTHDAIICRQCRLRVPFPKDAETYGDLRLALAPQRLSVTA